MDKLLILNRIKEAKKLSSDKELADFLGITKQTLANWRSRNTLDYDLVFTKCVDIDPTWLITGESNTNHAYSQIESPVKTVSEPVAEYGKKKGYPLLPFDAFGGNGDDTAVGVDFSKIQERYVVPLFEGSKIDFMIPVRGSSMYPKYNSGDVVACRLIKDLLYVQWNKTYVIDTYSQGTMIKRLKKSNNEETVICKSDNKDYEEFEIPKSDIRNIAIVAGVVRLE